ncbi:MAG TPA: NAD(P)-dependent oxidoreductase [Acidimicrobiales bacterium]|nr:NAD(P)-dependent oxidoreductase [Acidimicrobiales bacterium]
MPNLAVVGLGTMGGAMAATALRAGVPTVVWNRKAEVAERFADQGAVVASSVAEAVGQADVVITMVTNADAVTSLATEQGMLAALASGAVWAQMSTIGVSGTERLAALVRDQRPDTYFVDAPVSGSKVPAEQGTLLIFASGPGEARSRVAPVFDTIGQRTVWLGSAGAGSRMKLVNNVLLAFTAEGVANSFGLAQRLGLETDLVLEAFDGSPLVSAWESAKFRRIATGEYSAEFALALALKDVHLALAEGGAGRFRVLAALAEEWDALVGGGLGQEDVTVVTRALSG